MPNKIKSIGDQLLPKSLTSSFKNMLGGVLKEKLSKNNKDKIIVEREFSLEKYPKVILDKETTALELKKSLPLVHLTDVFPINGLMKCGAIPMGKNPTIIDHTGRTKQEFSFRPHLHFSMGPVADHADGQWSSKRFGILLPYTSVEKKVMTLNPFDTILFGDLYLPKGTKVYVPFSDKTDYSKYGDLGIQIVRYRDGDKVSDVIKQDIEQKTGIGFNITNSHDHNDSTLLILNQGDKSITVDPIAFCSSLAEQTGVDIESHAGSLSGSISYLFNTLSWEMDFSSPTTNTPSSLTATSELCYEHLATMEKQAIDKGRISASEQKSRTGPFYEQIKPILRQVRILKIEMILQRHGKTLYGNNSTDNKNLIKKHVDSILDLSTNLSDIETLVNKLFLEHKNILKSIDDINSLSDEINDFMTIKKYVVSFKSYNKGKYSEFLSRSNSDFLRKNKSLLLKIHSLVRFVYALTPINSINELKSLQLNNGEKDLLDLFIPFIDPQFEGLSDIIRERIQIIETIFSRH